MNHLYNVKIRTQTIQDSVFVAFTYNFFIISSLFTTSLSYPIILINSPLCISTSNTSDSVSLFNLLHYSYVQMILSVIASFFFFNEMIFFFSCLSVHYSITVQLWTVRINLSLHFSDVFFAILYCRVFAITHSTFRLNYSLSALPHMFL